MNSDISHITPSDLAFLGEIFVGITLALLLLFTPGINKAANRFLALAVVMIVVSLAWILSGDIRIGTYYLPGGYPPLQFLLAFGPFLYFYVLKLAQPDHKFGLKSYLHFVPALMQQLAWACAIKPNPAFQLVAFISAVAYLYLSHRSIERFYRQLKFNGGDRYRYELRWLHHLLSGFGLLWLFGIAATAANYFYYYDQSGAGTYGPLYVVLAALTIWTAATAYLRQDVRVSDANPLFKPSLPAELKQKGAWLKKAVKENRYYEDPELNLRSLAEKLDLHPNDLSRIINTSLKKSFNDFINEFRVGDVTWKMQDPAYDHMTLLGIAYESGFNSKTTFHRIFKEMTGKSPAEYKTDQKNELPSYNLEPRVRFAPLISYQENTLKWAQTKSNRNPMIKNYFKTAWRSLLRNKSYTAINIIGLAIGIASCLLIFFIIHFETSFDNFHKKKDHIYRVITATKGPQGLDLGSGVPFPTAKALRLDYPQLKDVATILRNSGKQFTIQGSSRRPGKKFREDEAYYAEPQFFDEFDFEWLAGDKQSALSEPNTVVLTQAEAEKFFGNWKDAIGKIIRFENKTDLKVTGILKNMPANTDFPLKIVMSYATGMVKGGDFSSHETDWVSVFGSHYVFVVLPGNMSVQQFNADLAAFVKKHKPAEYVKDGMQLQSLADMHYNDSVNIYTHHTFNKRLLNAIALIGLFLLTIACVNFINLSTAQAVNRSKEVGIRKVLGSNRKQLILQFISETFIITFFAAVLAVAIAVGVLPLLNQLLQIEIGGSFVYDTTVLLFLVAVVLGVTFLAGFYPAMVLSGFNPISALKNKLTSGRTAGVSLRRALVVFQFGIAQVLVIGTLVIISQMDYFKNKSLGFVKDAVITVTMPNDSTSQTKLYSLRDKLLAQPGIKNVSYSFASPSDNGGWSSDFKYNNSPKKTDFEASLKWADPDYFELYKMQFVAGRPFAKTDTVHEYVVNETLLKKLGIRDPKEAIGKYINLWDDKSKYAQIVGVVKDFNVSSLKDEIPAVIMASWKGVFRLINIKIQPVNVNQTLASTEKIWNYYFPDGLYEYQFLDEKIERFYRQENQQSTLYKVFAGIAIFISCLGLYGLVSFMAVQRTKEVGIRKTLGASVGNIVYLFSREFTVLILIAFAISAPIGYYLMYHWLQDFTYKITIGPGIFIVSIFASVLLAWLTVGYKAVKAALANPVTSLRSE